MRYDEGVCITTNTVEGYFATLKRGINGVYHHVGGKHLHRNLGEFDFRYNSRKNTDGERAHEALKGFEGKRLTYKGASRPKLRSKELAIRLELVALNRLNTVVGFAIK